MTSHILENYFHPFIKEHQPPALVAGLISNGKLSEIYSFADDNNILAAENWVFRIASMTKCFVAAATLLLRDKNKLSLSDKVINYLPQLKNDQHLANVSIQQLLTMQSGLPTDDPWADRYLGCSEEMFDQILKKQFIYAAEAGDEYHYSNFGYMILGRILTQAAGKSILTFIEEQLLIPLGMSSTGWQTKSQYKKMGYCYRNGSLVAETDFQVKSVSSTFAGLWSNITDLAIWVSFILDPDHQMSPALEKILSSSSRRELQSSIVPAPSNDPRVLTEEKAFYGFGLKQFVQGKFCSFGHSGGLPGYGSHFRWSREKNFGIIACANLTYCPVWNPCRELMYNWQESKNTNERKLNPLVSQRSKQLFELISRWNEETITTLFSHNFFDDFPKIDLQNRFQEISNQYQNLNTSHLFVTERGLGAKLIVEETPLLIFTLAPTEEGKIQEIKFLNQVQI